MGYLLHFNGVFFYVIFVACVLIQSTLAQATSFNFAGLLVARIGLGVFEACFGPGIPVYLVGFYGCVG